MPSIPPLSSRAQQQRVEAKYNVVTDYPNLRLHGAAAKGDIGLVQYALTHGQPANSVLDGILPLHAACSGGSEIVVKLLIDFGADVNAPRLPRRYSDKKSEGGTIIGSSGSTPLHFAAANGHLNIVKILLSLGADPTKADKHGTKPETLATNFGHDAVTTFLKDWEAMHPLPAPTPPDLSRRSSHEGPPSPTKSKKLQMKRSLENLLSRKPYGGSALPALTPLALDNSGYVFGGSLTPATAEAYGSFTPSASRRPSLPHIFERSPTHVNPSPLGSPSKATFHRPRSTGGPNEPISEADLPPIASSSSVHTMPHQGHGRRLASKLSVLNIFKKASTPTHPLNSSPSAYNASSPNLVAALQPPAELGNLNNSSMFRTARSKSSSEEPRGSVSSSAYGRHSYERDRPQPGTAPPNQTTFQRSPTPLSQQHQYPSATATGHYPPARTSRSNSQPRPVIVDHLLRPRNDSISSSSSFSYDSHNVGRHPYAVAAAAANSKKKRDRSASEGATARLNAAGGTDWKTMVREERELPGVILDEEPGEEAERDGPLAPIPNGADVARRPSLTMTGVGNGDSSGGGPNSAGHNRTNSAQSAKNLRFADLPPSPSLAGLGHPTVAPQRPVPNPFMRLSDRVLRPSASVGSLQRNKSSGNGTPPIGLMDETAEVEDEEDAAVEAAEGADSLGELADDPRGVGGGVGAVGTGGSGAYGRPSLMTNVSVPSAYATTGVTIPTPTALASPAVFSPMTPGTASSGGRPWALPQQTWSPEEQHRQSEDQLGAGGGRLKPNGADVDSRLRGASISSSKSTETTTTATSESSGGNGTNTSVSVGGSTAKIGGGGARTSSARAILAGPNHRHPRPHGGYEIEEGGGDSDSFSSAREFVTSPTAITGGKLQQQHQPQSSPIPILLRSVNSHAQAHALVEKAEQDILSLAELPPNSAGFTGDSLAAQLAAYGETLALERRFARGEKQRMVWLRDAEDEGEERSDGDGDEDDGAGGKGGEAFAPPKLRRKSSGGAGMSISPTLKRAESLEFAIAVNGVSGRAKSVKGRGVKSNAPSRTNTSPTLPTSNVVRTTPSNVGPPVVDLNIKSTQHGAARHLNHLVLGGIEITETLPTPTDSPRSVMETPNVGGADTSGEVDSDDGIGGSPFAVSAGTTPDTVVLGDVPHMDRSNSNSSPTHTAGAPCAFTSGHSRTASNGTSDTRGAGERIGKKLGGGFRGLVQTLKGKA